MIYPRIYSLSTVGIRKHYMHDYLFHPLRTDFIGDNGIGKSIISDILQLLFIYDSEHIKFGTEGLNQDKRDIHTLPYKTTIAYSFINVEVEKDRFVILGVAISAQSNSRLAPFVITKISDITKGIEDISLSTDQILLAKDFLQNQTIPDLKTLSTSLFQDRQLYLTPFRNKEEVKKYYSFLYDKGIISINLTNEENLKAFAKVLQSFSKAKALKLDAQHVSRSLKEFLFEDSDIDLHKEYDGQQHLLEKLLREYYTLDKYIVSLERKQMALKELKAKNEDSQAKLKSFKIGEVQHGLYNLRELNLKEENEKLTLESYEKKRLAIEVKLSKLPKIGRYIKSSLEKAKDGYELHVEYRATIDEKNKIDEEVNELNLINLPILRESWATSEVAIDISLRKTEEIKGLIKFARPIIAQYETQARLEDKWKTQKEKLENLNREISDEISSSNRLISFLESNSKDSLLNWIMLNGTKPNSEQRSAIVQYMLTPIIKPSAPVKGTRYIDPAQLFKEFEIEADNSNGGFWLKLGAFHEFISLSPDADLFKDPNQFNTSISAIVGKLRSNVKICERKRSEMDKISKGEDYDKNIIKDEFDLSLTDYGNVKKVKEAVYCILNLDEKMSGMKLQSLAKEARLREIRSTIPVNIVESDPEVVKKKLKRIFDQEVSRNARFEVLLTTIKRDLEDVGIEIAETRSLLISTGGEIISMGRHIEEMTHFYFIEFSENIDIATLLQSNPNISLLKAESDESSKEYHFKYREIISQFDEVKDGTSVLASMEVSSGAYKFNTLEEAILGSKITHTDNIAAALTDANNSRMNMADEIKNSMVKVFDKTVKRYREYKELVQSVNVFFKERKISDSFYFKVDLAENKTLKIEFIEDIGGRLRTAAKQGELAFDKPVSEFIEEFFKKSARIAGKVSIYELLNPKTYFDLSVSLTDQSGEMIPGSTGETYSAIALLGIARLSIVNPDKRKGLRFIILEEIGSLDNVNFSTFPAIAKEFDYQIITMAPQSFKATITDEWYAHHLIKGKIDKNINFWPSASYFKTKDNSKDLFTYLKLASNELDSSQSSK